MKLTRTHSIYVFLVQGVGAGVVNILINGAIAWGLFRSKSIVPLWGLESVLGDTLATTFLLPFFTCLIVTRLVAREINRGKLIRPEWSRQSLFAIRRLPENVKWRAAFFGVATLTLCVPPTALAFAASDIQHLSLNDFILFKAFYAGGLATVVTPLIALAALGDLAEKPKESHA